MRVAPIVLAALAPLYASTALAQQPVIAGSPVPATAQFLNIEKIDQDAPIELDWTATVNSLETYQFEISYDLGRSTTTTTVTLVHLDDELNAGLNTGTVRSGVLTRFRIRPSQVVPTAALPGGTAPADDTMRTLVLRVFRAADPTGANNTSATHSWTFKYDTKPPSPPTVTKIVNGENRLQVEWAAPSPDTDVDTYSVVYCPNVGTSTAATLETLPCAASEQKVASGISKSQTTYSVSDGLANDITAAVAVRSTDKYGNVGELSAAAVGTPQAVTDFFELYKEGGGKEDGGFCFIATAAYGSYAHPTVRVLRAFRDLVLKETPLGTLAVWSYYHYSPPLAGEVAKRPALAAWTRVMLVPVALLALVMVLLPLGGLVALLRLVVRRRRVRGAAAARALTLVLVGAGALSLAGEVQAAQLNRPKSERRFGLAFELKGGPYLPALGQEGGGPEGVSAFEQIFSSRPKPLFQLGGDLQLYRGVGTFGVGAGFGFMQFVGKSFYGANGSRSPDTTVFNILPLALTAFYRFDWLADRAPIPFVPYLRGGLAYDLWWVTTGTGDISRYEGASKTSSDDDVVGRGGKLGLTGTAGVAFLLNVLDQDASRSLFDSTGIRGTYLFVEYTVTKIDGFGGGGFDLSDDTWNAGVYFEW